MGIVVLVGFKGNLLSKMKQIIFLIGVVALGVVSARPRYLVIPIEDVEFMDNMQLPVYTMPQLHHRIRRQAPEEQAISANNGAPIYVEQAQRRDDGIPAFSIPAEIRQAEDAITLEATIMHMEVTALTTLTMVHTLVDMELLVGTLIIQLADIIAVKRFCS